MREETPAPVAAALPGGSQVTERRVALLLTEEDLHPESWDLTADVAGCAALGKQLSGSVQQIARIPNEMVEAARQQMRQTFQQLPCTRPAGEIADAREFIKNCTLLLTV